MTLPVGALVLYRQRPAVVKKGGDKLTIAEADGRERSVREKDLRLLHAGPVARLDDLDRAPADLAGARELLAEEPVPFADFIAICFDEDSPAAAWSAWSMLFEGRWFIERDGLVHARSEEEIAKQDEARDAKAIEAARWQAFSERVAAGTCDVEADAVYLDQIRRFACGQSERCGVLAELQVSQEPEVAHALLLRLGAVDETWIPAIERNGVSLVVPSDDPPAPAERERVDRCDIQSWAIDDVGNEDPDDAIAYDGDRIWVHVADVGTLVEPDGPLDRAARERGATLYLPDRIVPMLPDACCQQLGIGLQERSPALSIGFRVNDLGDIHDPLIERSWVRARRTTYAEADHLLDDGGPLAALHDALQPAIDARHYAAQADFELPEVRIRLDDAGQVEIRPLERGPARSLVMEAMLFAGVAVAQWAADRGLALPHASQPAPGGDPVDEGAGLARQFARMRQMAPSRQTVDPAPHAGLGLERYVRATSPLRRYGDCLVHQQIAALLDGREPLAAAELGQRLAVGNDASMAIRRAERAANRHWTLVHLRRQQAWRGEAVLVEQGPRGALVIIPELAFQCPMRLSQVALDQRFPVAVEEIDLPRQHLRLRRLG